MEKWRKVQIEALDTMDHMLEALDIPHRLMNHDWVEVTGTSLHIQADYDNWSDTVTTSIWNTDDNDDTRVIWGMTLPYESMDELMGHLHAALTPLMKQYGDEEDMTEHLSDDQEHDREFVVSVFDDLTKRMRKECNFRGIGICTARTVRDEPDLMVRDQKFYLGNAKRTKVLRFHWDSADNSVAFVTMPSMPDSIPDDYETYTVDGLRGIDRAVLWDRVFGMVITSLGSVITV